MEAALRRRYGVLRPGGRLLITPDNPSNPRVRLRTSLPPRIFQRIGLMPFPWASSSSRALRAPLEKVGFEVQDLTTLMHVPRAPAVALVMVLDGLDESSLRACVAAMAQPGAAVAASNFRVDRKIRGRTARRAAAPLLEVALREHPIRPAAPTHAGSISVPAHYSSLHSGPGGLLRHPRKPGQGSGLGDPSRCQTRLWASWIGPRTCGSSRR